MIDILSRRNLFFIISLLIIIPGIIALFIWEPPLAIDFTGGSLLEVRFEDGKTPQPSLIVQIFEEYEVEDVQVQTTGEGTVVIRSSFMDESIRSQIINSMEKDFSSSITILRSDSVGPTIGTEVTNRAGVAVAVAAIAVIIYITFAFRGIQHAFRYGVCAIIAMVHDVAVVVSLIGIGGHFWGWQIDSLFLTALLTVIGFSVQDKIVVFDRIRENTRLHRKLPFDTLVNHSIVQTLQRSINTQLMTVEFMLLALALFGGVTLREFATILLVGLFSGTYSSIFIAAPILVAWENREWKNWLSSRQQCGMN